MVSDAEAGGVDSHRSYGVRTIASSRGHHAPTTTTQGLVPRAW